jgi:hypothetical protein
MKYYRGLLLEIHLFNFYFLIYIMHMRSCSDHYRNQSQKLMDLHVFVTPDYEKVSSEIQCVLYMYVCLTGA